MAIYHFSAKLISRAAGSSALASAAYRSASRLHDQRLDRHHDFSNKAGVVHSEIMLPDGAPEHLADREKLWNAVEGAEKRIDAQLAREIEFAIPREMSKQHGIELARDFVRAEFVERGMIADLNVHWDIGADGEPKPHAHVMLTTRSVDEDGFGAKVRDWNRTDLLQQWREHWAVHVNHRLAELDIDARVDHRSLDAQGIDLEPQHKIGPAASRMAGQGHESERLAEHHDIARSNGERILANPGLALDAITKQQATFTRRDLAMFVHRHSDGQDQFDRVMGAVRASPEFVLLGKDGRCDDRFTSRDMIATEERLDRATMAMASRAGHGLPTVAMEKAIDAAGSDGLILGGEQKAALDYIGRPHDLAIIVGYAGTGKSAMLGVARDAWERAGYSVRGLALSGIAAESLEGGSGIASRTIASMEHQWGQGRELLDRRSILVIDEAGMIGTRQMERVIAEAQKRGAKVVLAGDPEQGAAFRSIAERVGCVEITEVRRQRDDWQRRATRELATGRTAEAVEAYHDAGHVHAAPTRDAARGDLIERWDRDRTASPNASRIILTHTNEEVQALNATARGRLGAAGRLGTEVVLQVEKGERAFATGDRVMFLRNERELGVKNGSLANVESVTRTRMAVILDDGRRVAFDLKDYAALDHGYAATVHKAQGMTVDRVHVLATPGLDRHAAYVALSRHRDTVDLHYGEDDFADRGKLVRTLSHDRAKDMASDYARAFADRRQIVLPAPAQTVQRPLDDLAPAEGMMVPTEIAPSTPVEQALPPSLSEAVTRHARIVGAMRFSHRVGDPYTDEQRTELTASRVSLDTIRPHAAVDLESAFSNDHGHIREASGGKTAVVIRAMQLEQEIRVDPVRRADVFVERWQSLERQRRSLMVHQEDTKVRRVSDTMFGMAKGLERDPQVESILRNRKIELGLSPVSKGSIGHELAGLAGRGRSRGLGIGI
ncbi:MAG: Ti-type conjugative transfer relaxase TraA [Sphingomonas sp.]